MGRYVLVWVVAILAFLLALSIMPGFHLDTSVDRWWLAVLRLPLVFALLLIVLRPLMIFLTLPLNSLTLGAPTLFFNGAILYVVAQTERAIIIGNLGEALIGTLVMTMVSTSVVGWLGLDEAYPFYQSIIYRIGRRFGPSTDLKPLRGLLLLQIDGLSLKSLQRVLSTGRMPTVTAMLAKGSHKLLPWHCGIPSNTPAVQAGFMYGNRENVAGYRWFDRGEQRVRVVSNPDDLRALEKMVSAKGTPLLAGGSCINSFLNGGAAKRLMTVGALGEKASLRRAGERADFNLFFLSPNALTKAFIGGIWDYLSGLVLALVGRLDTERPRLKFSLKRVAQRAVANSFLRDLSFFWLKQDMVRGVPVIYSNFVGYDDVAHFTGPDTYEAQISLSAFDREFRKLRRRARNESPIRYDIVLFSDHGQTPSVPFRILYGKTIEATLAAMLGQTLDAVNDPESDLSPDRSYTLNLLAELEEVGAEHLGWAALHGRRALARITSREHPSSTEGKDPEIEVCVSGSLAHIYFTGHDQPLHLEEILVLFPGFIEQLTLHPGIGFVAASRQFGDAVAMCNDGIRNLITGELGGKLDPLAPFSQPDRWAGELARLMGYPDSGDLIINGAWLEDRDRIVVLEEQTSSHGGLGGAQTEPFILVPAHWDTSEMDTESPEALHYLFRRQLENYSSEKPVSE